MRFFDNINEEWYFKLGDDVPSTWPLNNSEEYTVVDVPHTWNNWDGQNGGENYYRGKGIYTKPLVRPDLPEDYHIYVEFEGINSVGEVYLDGKKAAEHRGGYSTFRVDITDAIKSGETVLTIVADNSAQSDVYPQVADFTFYGGMYRDVNIIAVPDTHFDLDFYGSDGFAFDTEINGDDAKVNLKAWVTNPQWSDQVHFEIFDEDGVTVAEVYVPAEEEVEAETVIHNVHLWQGVEDPYLYGVIARVVRGNETIDTNSANLGVREYYVDPEEGFFLNGVKTPLRGVARHQDRLAVGNALSEDDQWQDAELILEMGANTIRLAHYQHSQYFYDICDTLGFVVWAEIPFISVMNKDPEARTNTKEQMKDLVYQNYNHPSILFWGISNEITIGGDVEGLQENLEELEDLVKSIDSTRQTTMAQVSMLPIDSKQNQVTDTLSYNHYFGWYGGEFNQNEKWFDDFHKQLPDRPVGISEYGSEGIINWHTDTPVNQDYTEEYQTAYHEHMAKMIDERDYLWATHVWNMFDFGADNRDEGGITGRNNKGLVTFDREIKKDSYFIYKAYWSTNPFVHIVGRRYSHRPHESIDVKVYSNQDNVTLIVDGEKFATQSGDKVFVFESVPLNNSGFTSIIAEGEYGTPDSVSFKQVEEMPSSYTKPEEEEQEEGAKNWFEDMDTSTEAPDFTFNEEYFSVNDLVGDILDNEEATQVVLGPISEFTGMNVKSSTLQMMQELPLQDLEVFFGTGDEKEDRLKYINAELQKVKK